MTESRRACRFVFRLALGHILLTSSAVICVAALPARPGSQRQKAREHYRAVRQSHYEAYVQSLGELLRWCRSENLADAIVEIQRQARSYEFGTVELESLPERVTPPLPAGLPDAERMWRTRLREARQEHAQNLYFLSRRVLRAGLPSFAYALVREVLHYDPDHQAARRLLGYERYEDRWVTPYTASMLRRHYVWHERFGWLPEDHVARYERGERYFRGWMDAAREATLRSNFRNAWEVRTDHYLIRTNHSLERGVQMATALEEFYRFFRSTFIAFFSTPEQMQKLFEGGLSSSRRSRQDRPYEVHFFKNRSEYVQRLQSRIPQVAITNGLYLPEDRVIYTFFNTDPDVDMQATLFHEATHQLLYESQARSRRIANDQNFWVIEGIACYTESVKRGSERLFAGDPNYVRFQTARYRYVEEGFYVPLAQFTRMSKAQIQNSARPKIARIYTQASGLAYFFMEYDRGRYRDALIEHLSQIYNANPRSLRRIESLDELTGVSFRELDEQYGEFMRSLPPTIATIPADQEPQTQ